MDIEHPDDETRRLGRVEQPLPERPLDSTSRQYGIVGNEFVPFEDLVDRLTVQASPQERSYLRSQLTRRPHQFHWLFGDWPRRDPHGLLYHYSTAETATAIAKSQCLRLGSLRKTNDPREYLPWDLMVLYTANFGASAVTAVTEAANEYRMNSKLVCFATDVAADTTSQLDLAELNEWLMNPQRRRAYLRPRMWDQYGDKHQGVCLMFDRKALDDQMAKALGSTEVQSRFQPCKPFHGHVTYSNSSDSALLASSLGIADADWDLWSVVSEDEWIRGGFLVKDPDWISELEYRWGLLTNRHGEDEVGSLDHIDVDMKDCLLGVVVGLRAGPDAFASARQLVKRFDVGANVAQVCWRENRLDIDLIAPEHLTPVR